MRVEHIPDLKCVPNLEQVLDNKNALKILTVLFKQFPFRSVLLLIVPIFRMRSKRFFFRNDGIVLDRSVRSRERTIVPPGTRPALVTSFFYTQIFV